MSNARMPIDRLSNALYLAAAALLAYALLSWLLSLPLFALHRIEVRGDLRHVGEANVKLVASRGVRGNFFTVDIDDVRDAFEKLPWVREARVSRYWPDTLLVELVEHRPLARWNSDALLSAEGIVIRARTEAKLPKLSGFEGSGEEVAQAYYRFNQMLAPLNMHIADLSYSQRRAWRLKTEDGLEIAIGRQEPDARLQRFVGAYARTLEKLGAVPAYVDLRYADGFAVKASRKAETLNRES